MNKLIGWIMELPVIETVPVTLNSLVFLAVVCEDQVLEPHFHLHPLLVRQRRPDVMSLCYRRLVRLQDHLRPVVVHMERTQDQDQSRKRLSNEMGLLLRIEVFS